ncbi:MAG: hypothetical protein EP330_23630 [Deltaproteobacteria bacterium]|nr:MAG: hypothetical protein EP330_23630 [Deltaproteobacteria bacterium]
MSVAPYSFDRSGSIQVCLDGPEVLVYSGEGVPMWKSFLQGIAVAVHAGGQLVVTLDSDGRLVSFMAHDGTQIVDTNLGVQPVSMCGARDGRVAVIATDCVLLVSRDGESYRLEHAGGVAASFGGQGETQLAVVDAQGMITVFDVTTGQVAQQLSLGQPLVDVAWSGLGRWVALSNGQLFQVALGAAQGEQPAALQVLRAMLLAPGTRQVEVADDGVVAAVLVGDRQVWAVELWTDQRGGVIELHRDIGDVAFGVGGMLGIGLEEGDANRVNLTVGGSWRTNPGFGRGNSSWACNVQVDQVLLRSAVIAAKADGQAVARVVLRNDATGNNTFLYALGAFFAFCAICGGCSGLAGILYAFVL